MIRCDVMKTAGAHGTLLILPANAPENGPASANNRHGKAKIAK